MKDTRNCASPTYNVEEILHRHGSTLGYKRGHRSTPEESKHCEGSSLQTSVDQHEGSHAKEANDDGIHGTEHAWRQEAQTLMDAQRGELHDGKVSDRYLRWYRFHGKYVVPNQLNLHGCYGQYASALIHNSKILQQLHERSKERLHT